jgi:hypothetical protein
MSGRGSIYRLLDGICSKRLLSRNANMLPAMFAVDVGDVGLKPVTIPSELLMLRLGGLDLTRVSDFLNFNPGWYVQHHSPLFVAGPAS